MEDVAINMFQVRPGELSVASKNMAWYSSDLSQTHTDVSLVPPAAVFGLLPESARLAAALARCVQRSTTDLRDAVDMSADLGNGLATCAQNYVDHDTKYAGQIRRVVST
jgi:hypothetical protein